MSNGGMTALAVRNGTVVLPSGASRANVFVEHERIVAITTPDTGIEADKEIDATGLIVMPGVIDTHTHFILDDLEVFEPNPDEFEGLGIGSRAAAAGGVTCVVEMPHSRPPTTDAASFERKREIGESEASIDFALWGGIVPGQTAQTLRDQLAAGASALKAFMCGSDPLFPGVNDADLWRAFVTVAGTSAMIGVHAENDALLQDGVKVMKAAGRADPRAHAESRPPIVEIEAVARAITLGEHAGAHVHIVHLTTPEAAELIKAAKARGARITAETCPQYLLLNECDLDRLGGRARCAPPLRTAAQADAMWRYLCDGTLDCVTSDHCVYTEASKANGFKDIWTAPDGLPGVQTLLSLMISEGRSHGLDWTQIASLTATRPAELWGLAYRKGRIEVGMDADIVLVDPNSEWTITSNALSGAHQWTPFEGCHVHGKIVQTIRRGQTIFDLAGDEQFPALPGSGRFIAAHHAKHFAPDAP